MGYDCVNNNIFLWLTFDWLAFVFVLVVPFKCKEDMLPNNEQVQLCQEGAAVEPEYVSIFEGS